MNTLAKQCRNKAEKEGYVSCMNDTKWRELCGALGALDSKPRWRARDFLNGYLSEWDGDWFHHVGPEYCCIEWLEIDPMGLDRACLREVVCKAGAPFEDSEQFLRVIGYKR